MINPNKTVTLTLHELYETIEYILDNSRDVLENDKVYSAVTDYADYKVSLEHELEY